MGRANKKTNDEKDKAKKELQDKLKEMGVDLSDIEEIGE